MATAVNKLLAKLQAAVSGEAETVPAGWLRREEWARKLGRASSQTDRLLAAGVASGILERREFRIVIKSGGVRATPHWREAR